MNRQIFSSYAACMLVVWMLAGVVQAASIRQVGVNELLDGAALVFHGKVLRRWTSGVAAAPPVTHVLFEVREVLKGQYAQNTLELRFLGGAFGGRVLYIPEMVVPEPDEEGIYFVESLVRKQVNPLLGWSQGHFLIRESAPGGPRHMYSTRLEPIVDVQPAESPQTTISRGRAKGIVTRRLQSIKAPLTPEEFKARLRAIMSVP